MDGLVLVEEGCLSFVSRVFCCSDLELRGGLARGLLAMLKRSITHHYHILNKRLQFIHVGKCGGSTIAKLLTVSRVVADQYSSVYESHVDGVVIDSECDYLFCLRNPVARALSAFEWRKKLVLDDARPNQVRRFSGEANVLKSYGSLSHLARTLYGPEGRLQQQVARDFNLVHHLRESISFYLNPLMDVLHSSKVLGVICQETLVEDCREILGVDASSVFERRNESRSLSVADLDSIVLVNLKRYLAQDYSCLSQLWSLGILDDKKFSLLMFGDS